MADDNTLETLTPQAATVTTPTYTLSDPDDNSPALGPVIEPAEATPAEPVVHKHSKRLLSDAIELGIADDEIDSTPSDELDAKVYKLVRQRARDDRERAVRAAGQQRDPVAAGPAVGTEAPRAQDAPPPDDGYDAKLAKIKEIVDEDIYGLIADLVKDHREVRSLGTRLERQTGELREYEARRARESETQFVDRLFDTTARPELFGTGGVRSIKPEEKAKRDAVLFNANRMDPNIPPEKRFAAAVKLLYGESVPNEPDTKDKAELDKRLKDYAAGQTAKPTSRQTPNEPHGVKRAIKAVAQEMYGTSEGVGEDAEL